MLPSAFFVIGRVEGYGGSRGNATDAEDHVGGVEEVG
jgi:hypothetical protein